MKNKVFICKEFVQDEAEKRVRGKKFPAERLRAFFRIEGDTKKAPHEVNISQENRLGSRVFALKDMLASCHVVYSL